MATPKYTTQKEKIEKGVIIIPDISGYTRLVRGVDALTGRSITYELLSAIISSNELSLEVSEIEGDAVLFYRYGQPPHLGELTCQFERMLTAFNHKAAAIGRKLGRVLGVSLKMIVHYGTLAEYKINGFKKLYGESVIEAHRLLKNSVSSESYLLITDQVFKKLNISKDTHPKGLQAEQVCEVYGELRNICYTYYDYQRGQPLSKGFINASKPISKQDLGIPATGSALYSN